MNVDQIIFGCGRLRAGREEKNSRALIDTALELGITRFDVAPSYGLGLAEDVLGRALFASGMASKVRIATKYGVPRPSGGGALTVARSIVKPLANYVPGLPALALRSLSRDKGQRRGVLTGLGLLQSVEESLRRLKVSSVDCLLLHEAQEFDLDESLFVALADANQKLYSRYGSSTGASISDLLQCGSVDQFRVSTAYLPPAVGRVRIVHGALRNTELEMVKPPSNADSDGQGGGKNDVSLTMEYLKRALDLSGASHVIYSTTKIERLKALASVGTSTAR